MPRGKPLDYILVMNRPGGKIDVSSAKLIKAYGYWDAGMKYRDIMRSAGVVVTSVHAIKIDRKEFLGNGCAYAEK